MDKARQREISLKRAEELKQASMEYLAIRQTIPKGVELQRQYDQMKEKILGVLDAGEEEWNDWKWQIANRIETVDVLARILNLSKKEKEAISLISEKYRWSVSPYYLSIMDPNNRFDPVRLLGIPSVAELFYEIGKLDPMSEALTNPAGSITRRYPDRLIIYLTNQCANYCRHCQRRRNIGQTDVHSSKEVLQESIDYVRANPEIRDVLLTGGDALMVSDEMLEWVISELRKIPHVEIIRIGTRTIVTLPQRITPELCKMLKRYHPIFINTHFNHPKEITKDSARAAEMLADSGIPLGNQMVLLNGVNNDKYVVQCLNHELLKIRIRPYYIFHPKRVKGTGHFMCSVAEGIEIMEHLRGRTSGLAIPTYIINAPDGKGKTPLLPQYLISLAKDHITIRTWEGNIKKCANSPSKDIRTILTELENQI